MHDFTPEQYSELIGALRQWGGQWTMMHHVDRRPEHALQMARHEGQLGVKSSYYFRSMHFDRYAGLIVEVASLGHAIGYHYESLDTCKGDVGAAYDDFCRNLEHLRTLVPTDTACAHGSPWSQWDSRDIWNQYDRRALGIACEPMLDTDFATTLYLTDTGRRWDGAAVSLRDKVGERQRQWSDEGLIFHATRQIIETLNDANSTIHSRALLLNVHPQRWLPMGAMWLMEAVGQTVKNVVKRQIVKSQRC